MGRNCLVEYLTPECATCPDWKNTATECGCGIRAPIMECPAFARMYEQENGSIVEDYFPKLPDAIYMNTAGGDTIRMDACNNYCYTKAYYPTGNFPQEKLGTNIRRLKIVNAPFYIDGKAFGTTTRLFEYLLRSGKYQKYPYSD